MTKDAAQDWRNGGFGIYIHWPFCSAKCPYCDFNSHVRRTIDHERWRSSFVNEIRSFAELLPDRQVDTVFFGGGTPSLMPQSLVAEIIDEISRSWSLAHNIEISLEANPTSADSERFRGYAAAGVNRLSLGVQALDDLDLKRLGRLHSVREALSALDQAQSAFGRVSFDLIYARQGQTVADWESELTRAVGLGTDHLSLYQLTIEAGTRFGDRAARGTLRGLPNTDQSADLYEITQEICNLYGLPAYEVSNHARKGSECRHNLVYWRYGDFVGVGPGAHGRVTVDAGRKAVSAIRSPEDWLAAAEARSLATSDFEIIEPAEQSSEMLLMGLRLSEGVNRERIETCRAKPLSNAVLQDLEQKGFLEIRGDNIRATESGVLILDTLLEKLID